MVIIGAGYAIAVLRGQRECTAHAYWGPWFWRLRPESGLLVIDHVCPRHAGGTAEPGNLVVLCDDCNLIKSCFWPGHGYHPIAGYDDIDRAELILEAAGDPVRERLWALHDVIAASVPRPGS